MKRLFWSLFVAMVGGFVVWLFARRRMDGLYAEISRLREYERKYERVGTRSAESNAKYRKEEAARVAAMSPEERINYEMRQAEINSYIKSQIGEDIYNELTTGNGDSEDI